MSLTIIPLSPCISVSPSLIAFYMYLYFSRAQIFLAHTLSLPHTPTHSISVSQTLSSSHSLLLSLSPLGLYLTVHQHLVRIAEEFNIAVVVINQCMADPGQ